MSIKNPKKKALPPPHKPPKSIPRKSSNQSSLPKPKPYKILSPKSFKTASNQRKQKQIKASIQRNIKSLSKILSRNNKSGNKASPPSPTLSSSLNDIDEELHDTNEEEEEEEEKKIETNNIDIFEIYGIHKEGNTTALSWSNIINKYNFTQDEIIGARKLQFELSKLFNITSATNEHLPPFECVRYYCGCPNEVDRAIQKWICSIKMYKNYKMKQVNDNDVIQCFKKLEKTIAFGGYDCDGCRILVIKYSAFFFHDFKNINVLLVAGFYLFYYLMHDVKAHRNGVCVLCDLNGFSLANFSFTVEKTVIHFAQKVLPIRIKKVFVLDAPWIAHYALKLVLPLMTEKLRKRVFVVTNDELYSNDINKKIIHKNQLPVLVGGTFDEKYMNDNNNESFTNNILLIYFKQTINLNHFNVTFNVE